MDISIDDLDDYGLEIVNINKNSDSTVGNVYIIKDKDKNYVLKLYDDIDRALLMINLHNKMIYNNFNVPSIIKTVNNENYISINNKIGVMFSFMNGIQLYNYESIPKHIIEKIASEIRLMHDTLNDNSCSLDLIPFNSVNLSRKSIVHFDLTKSNIFYDENNDKVGFIDLDDAKYGESIYDVAIIISLLFISKKNGINYDGIKTFINSYYYDNQLKEEELPLLKKCAIDWIDYTIKNNDFNTSVLDSFELKKKLISFNDLKEIVWN